MKTKDFKSIIDKLEDINSCQLRKLNRQIDTIQQRKYVSLELETPSSKLRCPHCESQSFLRWGKRSDLQRYRCKECKKTYNSLTGTPLARLRRKGHWMEYAECIKDSLTIKKAAERCFISIDTAFRWRHRFLKNSIKIKASRLCGIVEANEIPFRISKKGCRKSLENHAPNNGNNKVAHKNRSVYLLISRDRNNNTFDNIFEQFKPKDLNQILNKVISSDILLCTDKKGIYKTFAKQNHIRHGFVDIKKGELVKKDIVHIKNVKYYHLQLLEWMKRFHGVATKYLENYISWYREFDELGKRLSAKIILLRAKSGDSNSYQPFI